MVAAGPGIFSIAPGAPFLSTLADALLDGVLVPDARFRSDPLALGDHQLLAFGKRRLEADRPRGPAIGAVDQAALVELRQVAAHGLRGDAKQRGEFVHPQRRRDAEFGDDPRLPVGLGHLYLHALHSFHSAMAGPERNSARAATEPHLDGQKLPT